MDAAERTGISSTEEFGLTSSADLTLVHTTCLNIIQRDPCTVVTPLLSHWPRVIAGRRAAPHAREGPLVIGPLLEILDALLEGIIFGTQETSLDTLGRSSDTPRVREAGKRRAPAGRGGDLCSLRPPTWTVAVVPAA